MVYYRGLILNYGSIDLIDEYFKPQGYELNGKINYRGERLDDIGMIYIKENNIQQICGRYDMNENELILSVTIDNDKKSGV